MASRKQNRAKTRLGSKSAYVGGELKFTTKLSSALHGRVMGPKEVSRIDVDTIRYPVQDYRTAEIFYG